MKPGTLIINKKHRQYCGVVLGVSLKSKYIEVYMFKSLTYNNLLTFHKQIIEKYYDIYELSED